MKTDVALRKQELISWISGIKDDNLIERLETIRDNGTEWTIEITDFEKKMLELAEADIEAGSFISNAKVMKDYAARIAKK